MKKVVIAILVVIILGVGLYFARDYLPQLSSSKGELRIDSAPKTTVFINGENRGQSQYSEQLNPGDYDVKLLPENESTTASWQQQLKVNPGVQTYINANLTSTVASSSWEIITLEKIGRGSTEISIFSATEPAEIFFDGERKGTTPFSFQDISAGTHDIRLIAPDHVENTIKITMTPGYKLTVNAQLSLDEQAQKKAEEEKKDDEKKTDEKKDSSTSSKTTITIKETPYGWLRVRDDSSTGGKELGKVDSGDTFELLAEENGWYKIEYEKGEEGWISGTYAEKNKDTSTEEKSDTNQ